MHGRRRWWLVGAVSLLALPALLMADGAQAQRRSTARSLAGESRIGGHVIFGLGGEADFDVEGSSFLDGDEDMITTFGFGLVFEHALHRYFLLGGRFEAAWWNTDPWDDNDVDRSAVLDFSPQVKVRYPFDLGEMAAEVSGTVPFGLTVSIPNDDIVGDWDTGVGFNVGILGGFALTFDGGFGVYTEMGWRWHAFTHEAQDADVEVDVATSQFVMHFGVMLGL